MTYEQAGDVCRELAKDTGLKDEGLAVGAVIRTLIKIAQNKTSPLAAAEAMEVLVVLDQGPPTK